MNAIQIPPIFIISLYNSPRRDIIKKRLDSLGLKFEFFNAIYGKDLSKEELQKIDYKFYQQNYLSKKPLTLGEIGCSISHIRLYEKIVKENISECIILEDDAILSERFKEIFLSAKRKGISNSEILYFFHGKAKSYPFKKKLIDGYKLVRYRFPTKHSKRCIIGAVAYYLTLNGAKKLINQAYPIRMPADYLTGLIQLTRIKAYGIEPSCSFIHIESEIDSIENRYD